MNSSASILHLLWGGKISKHTTHQSKHVRIGFRKMLRMLFKLRHMQRSWNLELCDQFQLLRSSENFLDTKTEFQSKNPIPSKMLWYYNPWLRVGFHILFDTWRSHFKCVIVMEICEILEHFHWYRSPWSLQTDASPKTHPTSKIARRISNKKLLKCRKKQMNFCITTEHSFTWNFRCRIEVSFDTVYISLKSRKHIRSESCRPAAKSYFHICEVEEYFIGNCKCQQQHQSRHILSYACCAEPRRLNHWNTLFDSRKKCDNKDQTGKCKARVAC
jgi:hypothetical protein